MPFDPLERRAIGKTQLTVTRMGLGGAPLGERQVRVSDEQANAIVQQAYAHGLRHFDTAPWYGQGKSELRMGRNLVDKPRTDFAVSTKIGRVFFRPAHPETFDPPWLGGGNRFDFRWDYSYDGVMRSYEDSLTRLGLNRVNMLLVHDIDPAFHGSWDGVDARLKELDSGGGFRALEQLRRSGEIQAIGAGVNVTGMIPRFLKRFPMDFFLVAIPYTLLDQDVLDEEFPLMAEHGATAMIGAVLASGILATGPGPTAKYEYKIAPPAIQDRVAKMQLVCARHSVSLIAAALQFPLAHPVVSSIIPGAFDVSHVTSNLADLRAAIPADFWSELKAEKLIRADAPTP
ncbi:MAG: aldo/keto reductase [Burkholderiaceae bacterium]